MNTTMQARFRSKKARLMPAFRSPTTSQVPSMASGQLLA